MKKDNNNEKCILILYGGRSTEHEISCRSAGAILVALAQLPYTLEICGISKEGIWYQQDLSAQLIRAQEGLPLSIAEDTALLSIIPGKGIVAGSTPLSISCVLPVLHGSYGEDGTLQGLLEYARLPYVGADVTSSVLGINKKYCKILWENAGLPILPFLAFEQQSNLDIAIEHICDTLKFPVFVKPNNAGSSVGISKVTDKNDLQTALTLAFSFDTIALVEQGIQKREIEVSVIGNHQPQVSTPGELIVDHDFYSYDAKYIDPSGAKIEIPANLDTETRKRIQALALQAYRCIGCKGLARVDFFIADNGNIYINEINTMPGFTSISMFPQLMMHDRVSMQELLQRLIHYAEERFYSIEALQYYYQRS